MSKPRQAAFIPGDGIGPEVAWAARRCVEATGAALSWVEVPFGTGRMTVSGSVLTRSASRELLATGLALKGPLDGSGPSSDRNPNTVLDELFEVFASVRHCRSFGAGPSTTALDLVVIAEQPASGGAVMERDPQSDDWTDLRPFLGEGATAAMIREFDPAAARAFFEFAFSHAVGTGRRKVTLVHRANVHRKTDGAWRKIGEEVARRYPGVACEDLLADHVAMQLARLPERFDVLVVSPLYGEIVGDFAVGLAGGVEFVPEILVGRRGMLFTTVHGTAPRFAGLRQANPTAMILSGAELLRAAGAPEAAQIIELSVTETLNRVRPGGIPAAGGLADAVIERIRLAHVPGASAAIGGA
ncbi:MAG: isocitrate/isopropylmalate family dehydrogenase [Candidatus Coatesbacteria bacterium]